MASKRAVQLITGAIQKLYPKELADASWDNTGLILGAALDSDSASASAENETLKVLLTIDLTTAVCDEAIKQNASMVMAYHPFIFRGLKSITPEDSQQRSLLKLARAGISVYCPHTAVDAAVGGVNDWLVGIVANGSVAEQAPVEPTGVPGFEGAGMGRVVKLAEPIAMFELVKRVKEGLNMPRIQVAYAAEHRDNTKAVRSVAICAGSGGSVLRGVDADVHFTGELGHHEALHLVESGKSAIVCGHSNTERGFLKTFRAQLLKELQAQHDGPVTVEISKFDKDPLEIV
ncbi:hypothetical protein TRVA0_037S00892 [Trichomonascus vanleenenianus]|uniref:uncharacterized protein n=1 Tax=Trichomonascus vanleenenianus TaxID=2268995 RepID=UPI003EC9CA52